MPYLWNPTSLSAGHKRERRMLVHAENFIRVTKEKMLRLLGYIVAEERHQESDLLELRIACETLFF